MTSDRRINDMVFIYKYVLFFYIDDIVTNQKPRIHWHLTDDAEVRLQSLLF